MHTIKWTRVKVLAFGKAYNKALTNGATANDTFIFEGNEFVMAYARYLLEYLASQFR